MRSVRHFITLAAMLLMAGCAGYHVGPTGGQVAGAKSIQIRPFVNKTVEPRLIEPFTSALRKKLQQDGTFRLETQKEGDVVVTGTIIKYIREGISFQPQDVLSVRDISIRVVVHLTSMERATGKILYDGEVTASTALNVGADLVSAERQASTLLAADFAKNAASILTEGLW